MERLTFNVGGPRRYDVLVISAPSIETQIKAGTVDGSSRINIARSGIGAGVMAGSPKPERDLVKD